MAEYKRFPYRSEFPDSSEASRNHQSLDDALRWARWTIHSRWRETSEYGLAGDYVHADALVGVITNRNTGYRWILRRDDWGRVEFRTAGMLEEVVSEQSIDVHLSVEEAEALARAATPAVLKDKRSKALVEQALDQIRLVCLQVRERVRVGDTFIDSWASSIPRGVRSDKAPPETRAENVAQVEKARYYPLGDPDNLSLKEAGEILGRARNTLYGWYRKGKLPPAVNVGPFVGSRNKPVVVVPRYRLDAWRAGERMPSILQEVFHTLALREPPWGCFVQRSGASPDDVAFWIDRRNLQIAASRDGRRIYGQGFEEGHLYDIEPRPSRPSSAASD